MAESPYVAARTTHLPEHCASANNGSSAGGNPAGTKIDAGWSSQVAREAHNLEVAGSNPVPAISVRRMKAQLFANPGMTGVSSCADKVVYYGDELPNPIGSVEVLAPTKWCNT